MQAFRATASWGRVGPAPWCRLVRQTHPDGPSTRRRGFGIVAVQDETEELPVQDRESAFNLLAQWTIEETRVGAQVGTGCALPKSMARSSRIKS
jgi:hypothetical protein